MGKKPERRFAAGDANEDNVDIALSTGDGSDYVMVDVKIRE